MDEGEQDTGAYRLVSKPVPSTGGIFHSGAVRAPGAQQATIADAQLIDMLAVASNMDPLAFRLQNMNTDLDGHGAVDRRPPGGRNSGKLEAVGLGLRGSGEDG